MTNRTPFKHKQGRPRGAPGKISRGTKLMGGGWGRHSSTLLQDAKIYDSLPSPQSATNWIRPACGLKSFTILRSSMRLWAWCAVHNSTLVDAQSRQCGRPWHTHLFYIPIFLTPSSFTQGGDNWDLDWSGMCRCRFTHIHKYNGYWVIFPKQVPISRIFWKNIYHSCDFAKKHTNFSKF